MKTTSRLLHLILWTILSAEMLFLLLPRAMLDLRVLHFFISANDQPAFEGQVLGMGILFGMMAVELYGLFILWWLALRCMKTTIKEIPSYIWVGIVFSVVSIINFMLPFLWALVAIPLFSTPKQMGMLQTASLIVIATAFAIMYWRGKQLQRNSQPTGSVSTVEPATALRWYMLSKKWKRGLIAVLFVVIGGYLLIPIKPQPDLTLEDVTKLKFRASVKHAPFDIPANYAYNEYSYFKKWPRPTQGEIDGTERKETDYIKVTVLLPDMSPYTAENAAEFEKPGWGKTVKILFGQEKNLNLEGAISRMKKMESSKLPGMLQYESRSIFNDEFFSPDHSINITCDKGPPKEGVYPSCEVLRPYRYKQNIGNTNFPVFHLRYHFSRDYMQQWREIDEQVQALFDRFAANAQHN